MVSTIHQLQHTTENEGEERFREGLLYANEQLSVWEDCGEHQKTQGHQSHNEPGGVSEEGDESEI